METVAARIRSARGAHGAVPAAGLRGSAAVAETARPADETADRVAAGGLRRPKSQVGSGIAAAPDPTIRRAAEVRDGDSINSGVVADPVVAERGAVDDVAPRVEPVARPVLRLVEPVPQTIKKAGSTRRRKITVQPVPRSRNARKFNDLHPPSIPGCKWKPSGLTGWELYTRQPAISRNGKRSSKHKYLAYYSQEAVRKLYEHRDKTAHA